MWNMTNTAKELLHKESQMVSFPVPLSLATCISSYSPVPLESTEDLRMFLQQASLANPSVVQENEGGQETSVICGPIPSSAFASYNPGTASWKMSEVFSRRGTSKKSSKTWPKAGMMLDGVVYRQQKWEHRIKETASGLWHTPTARDWKGYTRRAGKSICNQLEELFPDTSGVPHPEFIEELMGFPKRWTDLKPLGMHNFQQWLQQHGIY